MKKSNIRLEATELSDELKFAMINMMKYMVSNDWFSEVSNNEAFHWLSSGTGLSVDFIEYLVGDQSLYDEKFKAGRIANPFKEYEEQKPKDKRLKSDLIR